MKNDYSQFQDIPPRVKAARIFDAIKVKMRPALPVEDREALERCHLTYCKMADSINEESHRTYAHTYHAPFVVCVCRKFVSVPEEVMLGVLLHEIGHLFGGKRDRDADKFIYKTLGIRIGYEGKERLQWVSPREAGFGSGEWEKVVGKK